MASLIACAAPRQQTPETPGAREPGAEEAGSSADGADAPLERRRRTARAVTGALIAGRYEEISGHFTEEVRAKLPVLALQQAWEQTVTVLGAQEGESAIVEAPDAGAGVLRGIVPFQRGRVIVTLPMSEEGMLVGLFFKPELTVAPSSLRAHVAAEEVTIGKAPFRVGGTLLLPPGEGRVPGSVLLPGSGPQDREGTVGAVKPLRDLAEGLASRGIAALSFDKRTYTHGPRLPPDIGLEEEYLEDAAAAIALLRKNPRVDPERIFVLGHSLGALVAPTVAKRGNAAGVILLAPPGRMPWDAIEAQLAHVGAPAEFRAQVTDQIRRMKEGTLGEERILGAPASYWKEIAAHDGIGAAKALEGPVLILQGERDYQVTDADLEPWRKALAREPNVRFEKVAGANHLFVRGEGRSMPAEYLQPGRVDDEAIDLVSSVIHSGRADAAKKTRR